MKKLSQILGFTSIFVFLLSCSTQKDSVINRNFHALTTKYNVLFNGEQAFEKGLTQIQSNYKDNFWKRLPIEPITFDDRKIAAPKFNNPGADFNGKETQSANQTPFDRAEEKAVKAIQKHSMNINGYEKNRQIDDAYLLLGKSRYYTQRFIPAVEAFNYIIANYPNANLNYETRVWRAKANIRLGGEKSAIQSMKLLLKVVDEKEEIPKAIQEQAHTAMAMAYTETDTIQKVIEHLTKATKTFINKEQSARNQFILGQIYSELNHKDSARMVFKDLTENSKAPNKYRVHATIELAKNSAKDSTDVVLIDRLRKLVKNIDNRKYYDELYYQLGTLYQERGNTEKALEYYKKSLEAGKENNYQKTYTYEGIGNLYFNKQNYLLAGTYYDSVLQLASKEFENEKRIRRIRRKNKGLTSLRKYEDVVKTNDSILQLVAMSADERTAFFENYIERIKKEDEERRQQLLNSQNFGSQFGGGAGFGSSNKGKWYFYNSQSKAFGVAEFERVWGNRPLEDNWRNSEKTAINQNNLAVNQQEENKSRYELSTYLNTIPTDSEEINSLKKDRNDALYQLGLIYKEKFTNNQQAIHNLERLLAVNQNQELNLPIHYHLYQLYTNVNETSKAEKAKNYIVTNYPNSQFAQIITNPTKKLEINEEEDVVGKKYKQVYYLYKEEKYEEVVNQIDSFSQTIENSELIPKFALLKALAIGKYKTKEEYKKALEFVAFSYANRIEGKKAQEIINILK
ncbi:tetratricopeptide repeat protein [Tenacibaculum sp. IB213877]|uniref:type IX secretion system periplasmic lipoprotein PorW/SprE n=1 Tax=Tenacibaculum sp. IB213877 TaxID=3097351 RepID=UPI002A59B596|nr:tetratricopeptide repeat protein [Tenacibaculum sp. IB213877]MDY0780574.1 tetratricopeptide repeat protein [Tenacibaculum sp. IB213877]